MVTIVTPAPPRLVECWNCNAQLSYVHADVKEKIHYDYGGGSDSYKYITCPSCNTDVTVSS